ncbi:MAG: hypothetical protein LQ341_000977 [Variospora aurantia]|nr:MAG: hypothetical protein LQ341_000977 [Variospora aurantia]
MVGLFERAQTASVVLLNSDYKGRILELSPKNLARYAAISEATILKDCAHLDKDQVICNVRSLCQLATDTSTTLA